MVKASDLTGMQFGMLTVVSRSSDPSKMVKWNCVCLCGAHTTVEAGNLRSGHTKSCGCYRDENRSAWSLRHGRSKTPIHNTWLSMLERCENPSIPCYRNYGERGITVCEEWHVFENFLMDMGERPQGTSLDRIDNNGNYCKENCQWSTAKKQANNRRSNVIYGVRGKNGTIAQLIILFGLTIGYKTVWERLRRGYNIERALFTEIPERKNVV